MTDPLEPIQAPPDAWLIKYEADDDLLYVSIGEPVPSLTVDVDDFLLARVALATDAISGFEIEGFTRHYLPRHSALGNYWASASRLLAGGRRLHGDQLSTFFRELQMLFLNNRQAIINRLKTIPA
jgi:hypothetical protein